MTRTVQAAIRFLPAAALLLLGLGCDKKPSLPDKESSTTRQATISEELLVITPLSKRSPQSKGSLFESIPASQSGIQLPPKPPKASAHPMAYLYESGLEAGGVAIGDLDNDGLADIYITSSPGRNKLYRQTGDFTFEDITTAAGVDGGMTWGRGVAMVDIDNDADLDLYVANYGAPNLLFINEGNRGKDHTLKFTESAKAHGLDLDDASLMPTFCDYDRDGDLDLYLLTNQFHWPGPGAPKNLLEMRNGQPALRAPYDKYFELSPVIDGKVNWNVAGRRDFLFENDGRGKFAAVNAKAGISDQRGRGLSATWWDYNDDGWLDLYVGNDWEDADHLYRNEGNGTFKDVTADVLPHTTWFSMGSDIGDLNNDGIMDLLSADMSGTTHYKRKISMGSMNVEKNAFLTNARPPQYMRNAVYLGTQTERPLEAAYLTGLANSDWSWATKLRDFDSDGRCDVFLTNGMEQSIVAAEAGGKPGSKDLRKERNIAFRNDGNYHFSNVSKEWGIDHYGLSHASACGDLDGDGDLDLIVINQDENPLIYRNRASGNRCAIRLQGQSSNRYGIGATISVETPSSKQIHQALISRGYLGSDDPVITIGLGTDETITQLTVQWPSGHQSQFANIEANQQLTITEPAGSGKFPTKPSKPTWFAKSNILDRMRHKEILVDDFGREPLLPNKMSQLGPGLAVADIDGDGDEDMAQSGALGQPTMLLLSNGKGSFQTRILAGSEKHEDMGLLWFDADSDGDLDLYAVSGGVECRPGDPMLQDRLYLNDGKGNLQQASSGTLPSMRDSGGPVTAADFDRDGDLDLFVGSRVVPGRYSKTPVSHLLQNDSGRFQDVSSALAKGLANTGMVTSALFADVNNDQWSDLVVAHEWGPIKVFLNQDGRFSDKTEALGLSKHTGWWNSVVAGDVDNDGDLDLVTGNFGHNTKYHASPEKPVLLFCGTFGTDRLQLVEAEYEDSHLYPVRGKSCSTRAIPHLGQKFGSFHDFAIAELHEIYEKDHFATADRHEITTLDTGIFVNDGRGNFTFQALHPLAQIAPVFGISLTDFDGDGHQDIFLAQNFYGPQPETGRMAGGLSLLLRGDGKMGFEPVWPKESGVLIPEDATSVVLTDFNHDRFPDLVVGTNNGHPIALANQLRKRNGRQPITVRLVGPKGNPHGTGARITLHASDGSTQTGSVDTGSGYLSQSTHRLYFSIAEGSKVTKTMVQWPDGEARDYQEAPSNGELVLSR